MAAQFYSLSSVAEFACERRVKFPTPTSTHARQRTVVQRYRAPEKQGNNRRGLVSPAVSLRMASEYDLDGSGDLSACNGGKRRCLSTTNHLRHVESMATLPSGAGRITCLNAVILGEALASEEDDLVFPNEEFCTKALVPSPQKVWPLEFCWCYFFLFQFY